MMMTKLKNRFSHGSQPYLNSATELPRMTSKNAVIHRFNVVGHIGGEKVHGSVKRGLHLILWNITAHNMSLVRTFRKIDLNFCSEL